MISRTISRFTRLSLVTVLICIAVTAPGLTGERSVRYEKFADLNGKRIGVLNGTFFEYLVNDTHP
ncbi:MAG: hypothetical protein LIQ31_15900 [Planctomycetes bacterium]|nr:hypothetical protein [Planctomycetota bacterium]